MTDTETREAVAAISGGRETWNTFQAESTGAIKITIYDFDESNLSGFTFDGVQFLGSNFLQVDFDHTNFINCTFSNCTISLSSMVNCSFKLCIFKDCGFNGVSLRGSNFIGGSFVESSFQKGTIEHCLFADLPFSGNVLNNIVISSMEFRNLEINRMLIKKCTGEIVSFTDNVCKTITFEGSGFDIVGFTRCELRNPVFRESTLGRLEIVNSTLTSIEYEKSTTDSLDFSHSQIRECDLTLIPIDSSVLSKTTFRDCNWPNQVGTSTWLGAFAKSPHLLIHPINDVTGLDPLFSRLIAEQQLIVRLQDASKNSFTRTTSFRLWGILTDYGRSLSRFAVFCILAVLVFAALQVISCTGAGNLAELSIPISMLEASVYKFQIFLGFPVANGIEANICRSNFDFPMRLTGFIALGLWIGLAAGRLGFLSSVK